MLSAFSLLGAMTFGALGACSDASGEDCGPDLISRAGVCEPKCSAAKCLPGNICVDNRCVLECDAHGDCLEDGTQDCAPAVNDAPAAGGARETMTCQPNGKTWGVGVKCPFGTECDGLHACTTTGEHCDLAQCGGVPKACKLDTNACNLRANCNIGKCPDGSACTYFTCTPDECKSNLSCVTKGDADADAYCAKNDCEGDADCPGGFYCGTMRDRRELCDSMPQKGNSDFCGGPVSISVPCVPASDLGKGNTLFEGPTCLLRKACLKRNECAPCETDLDCSQGIANHCIAMPNETQKRCGKPCNLDKDCGRDFACTDIVGVGKVCQHRTGACVGTGKFCEPCLNDTDCGPPTGTSVCLTHGDGQRGCADISLPDTCMSDADCPTSPSGAHAYCDVEPTSDTYQRCVTAAAINIGTSFNPLIKYTCW